MNKRRLEICLSPLLLPLFDFKEKLVLVTDVLRASSTIATGLASGIKHILPVDAPEKALAKKAENYFTAAERNGEKLPGFDFGNSPYDFMKTELNGEKVVLTTTNGTKCLELVKEAKQVISAAFVNLNSTCNYIQAQNLDVLILCAGWKNHFSLEDSLFAGAVANQLINDFEIQGDDAFAMFELYQKAENNLYEFLKNSAHFKRLRAFGIEKDLKFCSQLNVLNVVCKLENGVLVKK